jgi:4-amino-4-deoxy-L-arabinose transferase-like glycosyltransferase
VHAVGYGTDALTIQIDEERNIAVPLNLSFSDLRPRAPGYVNIYDYPALPWYTLFGLDRLVAWVGGGFGLVPNWDAFRGQFASHPIPFFLLGRTQSVVFGTATVALLYRLGRALFSPAHGLLAAGLLACAFLHVRDSALATVDVPVTFFIVLTLIGTARVLRRGRPWEYLWAGGAAGLATATKYSGVVVVVAVVTAHALRVLAVREPYRRLVGAGRLYGALGCAALLFLAVNPYLLLDWRSAWADLSWIAHRLQGGPFPGVDIGPGWWYHLTVSLRYGMGAVMLALAGAGALYVLVRRDSGGLMLLSFAGCFYLIAGGARLIFARYMTPLVPVLCLLAATATLAAASWVRGPRGRAWLVTGLVVATVTEPLDASASYGRMTRHADTRVEAYRFLSTELAPGGDVATVGPSEVWRSTIPPNATWLPTFYARHPRQSWADVLAALRQQDSRYLLVHTAPVDVFSPTIPELEEALRRSARLVQQWSPYKPGARADPVYDRADPYYFPLGRFRGVVRPGPLVRLYHLE